ncbi:right-handed parallel beta-helix repeat-containing protein [bacterium]|nr:right-handed parallel beta-helix repeat-containing protein [bacterium]
MKTSSRWGALFLVVLLTCQVAFGAELAVPDPFPTIQSAIDSAQAGDTILLAPGTYTGAGNVDVDFAGKQLVLRSSTGPDSTIIDCQQAVVRALFLHSAEDSATVISGITFANGGSQYGLVHLQGASPRIENCVFRDYYFDGQGTAVLCDSSGAVFANCLFTDNIVGCSACKSPEERAKLPTFVAGALKVRNSSNISIINCEFDNNLSDAEGAGGAISVKNSRLQIDSSSFSGNIASDGGVGGATPFGGAIAGFDADLAIARSSFTSNRATGGGGAVYVDDSSHLTIDSCTFEANEVDNYYRGGAILADSSVIAIHASSFVANSATQGGGVYFSRSTAVVSNSLIAHNTAEEQTEDEAARGGGLAVESCSLLLSRVTISHNRAAPSGFGETGLGGGLYAAGSAVTIDTSIISFSVQGAGVYAQDSVSLPSVSCSNIFGNADGDWIDGLASLAGNNFNFEVNPYYCDADADNFSLYDVSSCADSLSPCGAFVGAFGIGCINEAPVINSADTVEAFENQPFVFRISFADSFAPDTAVSYDSIPAWLTADGDSLYGTPGSDDVDTSFTVIVSDGFLDDSARIVILIVATNDPPQLNQVAPKDVLEGDSLVFAIQASDPDSPVPTLAADSLPYGAAFADSGNGFGRFRWGPEYWQAGQYEVYFRATDDSSAVDTMIVAITVINRNAAPEVATISDTAILEGDSLFFVVTAADPDSTAPVLSVDSLPDSATFEIDSSGIGHFSWSPGYDSQGEYNVFFIAVDDSLTADTQMVSIFVLNVNRAPVLFPLDSLAVFEGDTISLAVLAADPDSSSVSISADGLPTGATFVDSGNGAASLDWIPGYSQHGSYELLFFVTDDSLAADTQSLFVSVADIEVPPLIDSLEPVLAFEGDTLALRIIADDPDGPFPSLFAENLPAGSAFEDSANGSGLLSWIIAYGDTGTYSVRFIAEDTVYADTMDITMTVLSRLPEVRRVTVDGVAANLHVLSATPVAAWEYFDTANHAQVYFEIEFGDDADWSIAELWNPDSLESSDTAVVYGGTPLVDGGLYFVRVRSFNGFSWSAWWETPFRVNTPPQPPIPRSPTNGEIVSAATPSLYVLQTIDEQDDSLWYDFEMYADAALLELIADTAAIFEQGDSTGWTVEQDLPENATLWWRTRAFDGYEYGDWCDSLSFTLDREPNAPGAFTCLSPPSGADSNKILYDLLPQFRWSTSVDGDPYDTVRYSLILSTDNIPDFVTIADSLTDTVFPVVDSVQFGRRYSWYVESFDLTGNRTTSSDTLVFWTWLLGDVTHNHSSDLSDLIYLVNYLFLGGPAIQPAFVGDVTADCSVDLSDLIHYVNMLFLGGPELLVGCENSSATPAQ